jgi:xylan 1,4-beta-xylosidase
MDRIFKQLSCRFKIAFIVVLWLTEIAYSQKKEINLADPTIFYHQGNYYLYGTVDGNSNDGFKVYSSTDLKTWKRPTGVNNGYALRKGEVFGNAKFWAPQVFYHNDRFYMAYVADEAIAIAVSDSPIGPFKQERKTSLAASVKQIDPFVFFDDDGKKYLYHVRLDKGNRIFVAELTDDLAQIKPETLKECVSAVETWENTNNASWPVAEGPTVFKHKNQYYLLYTANDFRNPDYAVGFAVSDSPLGPWKKSIHNPILNKSAVGVNGTGHGDFLRDTENNLFYVFHTHQSNEQVAPRKTALIRLNFYPTNISKPELQIDKESFYYPLVNE